MSDFNIDLVIHHPEPGFREVERHIKKWSVEQTEPITVNPVSNRLASVLDRFRGRPDDAGSDGEILISLGFDDVEVSQALSDYDKLEVVLYRHAFDDPRTSSPSASMIGPHWNSTDLAHLSEVLRKALVRLRTRRSGISVREIHAAGLPDYCELRYRNYKSEGYIPEECDAARTGWELHYSDAWSLPLGAFDRHGRLIGCARLVSEFGQLNNYRGVIEELVQAREADDPKLRAAWAMPHEPTHPFDVLIPFVSFNAYYSRLVRDHVSKAELSRVIVEPEYRKQGLGEVIVDSVVSAARARGIQLMFLACKQRHEHFYARSGFRAIPRMECDRFGTFPVPAIAMEQWLQNPPSGR